MVFFRNTLKLWQYKRRPHCVHIVLFGLIGSQSYLMEVQFLVVTKLTIIIELATLGILLCWNCSIPLGGWDHRRNSPFEIVLVGGTKFHIVRIVADAYFPSSVWNWRFQRDVLQALQS